jgi:hypothetical protein
MVLFVRFATYPDRNVIVSVKSVWSVHRMLSEDELDDYEGEAIMIRIVRRV